MDISEWKLEDYAKHYVETLASPANAWGQHNSPYFGQSHAILYAMSKRFDPIEAADAVVKALKEYNDTHSSNA